MGQAGITVNPRTAPIPFTLAKGVYLKNKL